MLSLSLYIYIYMGFLQVLRGRARGVWVPLHNTQLGKLPDLTISLANIKETNRYLVYSALWSLEYTV